jgi:conjugative transposon TraN protein
MKTLKMLMIAVAILLTVLFANAQDNKQKTTETIRPQRLEVTFSKTVNLIYPYAVKSVDKGSKDLLVQVAKGVENILQVKAAVQGFDETNLTVITADGKLYSYVVDYAGSINLLNIKVDATPGFESTDARFSITNDNEASTEDYARRVMLKQPILKHMSDSKYDVSMELSGVYIRDHKLYFQLSLTNNSAISYDIGQLRFYIRDSKKAKRTASQETELQPLQLSGNTRIIRDHSEQSIVVTLDKFTIPDKKYMVMQLMEGGGGRNLELHIKNKLLVKARAIN